MKPLTEFLEAEIQEIVVRGLSSERLTQCFPCNLGHSLPGSSKCEMCAANTFFYVNEDTDEYYCKECPKGTYSAEGAVGEVACQPRRPCDQGDLDVIAGECKEGKREI